MTDTVLSLHDVYAAARRIPPRSTRTRIVLAVRRAFRRYWDYKVRQATMAALRRLDDRMLADIGVYRGDIESFVHDWPRDRLRPRDWI